MSLINYDFSRGDFDNSLEAAQAREKRARLLSLAGEVLTMLRDNIDIASDVLRIVGEEIEIPKGVEFPSPIDSEGQKGSLGDTQNTLNS